jgi:hypothetical protein
VLSKELESFGVLRLKVGLSLKVFLKVLTVVMAWDERLLVVLRVIEGCQSTVPGLPMEACFVLGVEELMKWLPVFEEQQWI